MTLQEYLAEQGLTADEVAAIVGNEKQSKAMIIEDECKRNLQVWLRIGDET